MSLQISNEQGLANVPNLVGRNKLINTNFEVPINQKGIATRVTTTGTYNFDQWYYGSDSKLYQPIEFLNLSASQVYTLSWVGTATAEYKFATVGSSGIVADAGAWTSITSGSQLTAPSDVITGSKFLWIRWTGVTSSLATFDKPQLEEGTVKTTYERKLYDQVLRECQRYLPIISSTSNYSHIGQCQSASNALVSFPLQVKSRIPTTGTSILAGSPKLTTAVGVNTTVATTTFFTSSVDCVVIHFTGVSGLVAGNATSIYDQITLAFTGAQI